MTDYILTDGQKAVSLTGNEGWTQFGGLPQTTELEQYAKVAAAFRAYNLTANTIGNMPFCLYRGDEEFDISSKWQNKVGFLPNPSELFRLDVLSLIATNSAYNIRTTDAIGYKIKGLYHAVAYTFTPRVNSQTEELEYIERQTGATIERYLPDDKNLVRLWRLDHTTEVLPSRNTEAKAIMSAAGQIYYADGWIQHFYARGGIPPTLIAMKGLIMKDKQEDADKSWSDWLRGLGKWTSRIARIFNAEAMDVKQMGSSITDLKNNDTYVQAIKNIAMGTGIPVSRLMSEAANYATAQADYAGWINDDIIPRCNWIAYEYNRQVFNPIGLRLEFKPETLDPEQEDETQRAQAISTFMDFLSKCPTFDLFVGACETYGFELSDSLIHAAEDYYNEKKTKAGAVQNQMTPKPETTPQDMSPAVQSEQPVKWIPSLDELNELKVWRDVTLRRFKKGESLIFEYQPHYGGLPESVTADITKRLAEDGVWDVDKIKLAFDIAQTIATEYKSDDAALLELAAAINKLAEAK